MLHRLWVLVLVSSAATLLAGHVAADGAPEIDLTVLLTSDGTPPGVPEGSSVARPYAMDAGPINEAGRAYVTARLIPPGGTDSPATITWVTESGAPIQVFLRPDLPLSGTSRPLTVRGAGSFALNDDGESQWVGNFTDGTHAVVRHTETDGHRILVERGEHAPGTSDGTTFNALQGSLGSLISSDRWHERPTLTQSGRTAIFANLTGPGVGTGNDWGTWASDEAGEFGIVTREGNQPPDTTFLHRFTTIGPVAMNDDGYLAYQGNWIGFGAVGSTIVTSFPDGIQRRVINVGAQAPGKPAGVRFAELEDRLYLSNPGRILFGGNLRDSDGEWSGAGWWVREPTGVLTPIALQGDPLPGLPDEFVVRILLRARMSDSGRVVFNAEAERPLTGARIRGIWEEIEPGTIESILVRGDPIPGRPGLRVHTVSEFSQHRNGDLVMLVSVEELDREFALLFRPEGREPLWILGPGDLVEVAPGDVREIRHVTLTTQLRSTTLPLNGRGQMVIGVRFTDGEVGAVFAEVSAHGRDTDGDGVSDLIDVCPEVPDEEQSDRDGDGIGDACNSGADGDGDDFADDIDNCPDDANDQLDVDGDGLGNACDPFPLEPDNEKGQMAADLVTCRGELEVCLDRRFFEDGDGDGEDDATDACPNTPAGAEVDGNGCSLTQFCGELNALDRVERVRACTRGDWRNDELHTAHPRDCALERSGRLFWFDRFSCEPAPD